MTGTKVPHVEYTKSIDAWLRRVGLRDEDTVAQAAVDIADLLHAASDVRDLLGQLMAQDLKNQKAADEALQLAVNIEIQLFSELKDHLESLQQAWPKVVQELERHTK